MLKVSTAWAISMVGIASLCAPPAHAAFEGAFDLGSWQFTKGLNSSTAHVDLSDAPDSFTLYGNTAGLGRTSDDAFHRSAAFDFDLVTTVSATVTGYQIISRRYLRPIVQARYTTELVRVSADFDVHFKTEDQDGTRFDRMGVSGISIDLSAPGEVEQRGQVSQQVIGFTGGTLRQIGFATGGIETFVLNGETVELKLSETTTFSFSTPRTLTLGVFAGITSDGLDGPASLRLSNFELRTESSLASGRFNISYVTPVPSALLLGGSALTMLGALGAWQRRVRRPGPDAEFLQPG